MAAKKSTKKSSSLFLAAKKIIPGGVNSPVRAFSAVGGKPLFIKKASGPTITDADNNTYIDYIGSWGPMIVGHAHPAVTKALAKAAARGTSFGAPTELETTLARMTIDAFPSMDMVRFVSSGTEATMSALRLARAYTGRDKIIKFEGCYHGHGDSLLVKAGSGAATLGIPSSPGVPKTLARNTLNAQYNHIESVEKLFKKNPDSVACVIVEGVPGNMGVVLPKEGFLQALKKVCRKYGALLIMDEVMSGFRLCYGGAQQVFKIDPDITCLGKVIGGGMPVGAFGGKKEIMEQLAPLGPVYQAGTLSGNPLAMTAGIATLKILGRKGVYPRLLKRAKTLTDGITKIAEKAGVECSLTSAGAMFTLFFNAKRPVDYAGACACDLKKFSRYFKRMLEAGVMLPPSQFEANFIGLAHTPEVIGRTLEAVEKCMKRL